MLLDLSSIYLSVCLSVICNQGPMQRHKHRDNERLSRISVLSCGSILDCLLVMKIRHMYQGDQRLVVVCVCGMR